MERRSTCPTWVSVAASSQLWYFFLGRSNGWGYDGAKSDLLPPIIPQPATRSGRDVFAQGLLQLIVEVEVRPAGEPVDPVLLEDGRRVGREGLADRARRGVGAGFLVRVMHALPRVAGDNFDVHFLVVVLVEKGAVARAGDGAGPEESAYAAVENVVGLGGDLGSEDGGCALAPGYLQLQGTAVHSDVGCGVKLRVRR